MARRRIGAAEPVVQAGADDIGAEAGGMRERLVRKERREIVRRDRPCGVAEIDEEVLGLDTEPIRQRRFDAAADRIACLERVDAARTRERRLLSTKEKSECSCVTARPPVA